MQRLCLQRHVEDKVKLSLLSGLTHFEGDAVDKCGVGWPWDGKSGGELFLGSCPLAWR
jgi:hypothetical protein